jgi:Flp pilus assembly CpaF family ATPase
VLGPQARAELVRRVAERSFGLGPLEPLLADEAVDEIIVNGAGPAPHRVGDQVAHVDPQQSQRHRSTGAEPADNP